MVVRKSKALKEKEEINQSREPQQSQEPLYTPAPKQDSKTEPNAPKPVSNTPDLGDIEREKSRLMQELGVTEKGAIAEIQRRGGTESFFQPQVPIGLEQQRQQAVIAAAQQEGTAQPSINLGTQGFIEPSTIVTNLPALGAGTAAGVALGAKGGALIGAAGGPIGAAGGAVIGGVAGGLTAYLGKLALDRRQNTKNAKKLFSIRAREIEKLINSANASSDSPTDLIIGYEANLADIRESQRSLRELTKNKVEADLSGAMDELIEVELWLQNEPIYRQQLLEAIANPDPSKIRQLPTTFESEAF